MNKESLTAKLLDLVEGRETPESWRNWWDEHEPELETLLSRGEFLKLTLPTRFSVGPGVWQPKGSHRHSGKERHSI